MKKYSFLVSGLALMMLATGTVKAEEISNSNVVNGTSLNVTKSLDVADKVLVPNTTFTFTISGVSSEKETTKDGLTVYEGLTTGLETSKTVSYTNTDTTDSKEKTVAFDFSGVNYPKPGVYRYLVTETSGNTPGVTYSTKKYVVDVYVLSEGDTIKPKYIVSRQEGGEAKEPIKFDNALKTTSLTVKKSVTGNAGDKNKEFGFTITLKADDHYKNGSKIFAKVNDKTGTSTDKELSMGANQFTLKDGESLSIDKLPIGITYKVEENKLEDYKVSAELTENNQAKTYNFTEQISDETPDTIVVTNNKNINTPTGVAMAIAPYAVMTLVGIGGVLYFVKNKKA
ncbi:MAG: QVPTGV class sortase B protein-sorting domain-containing protein [Streptococcus suis]|uniref:QVPTGV class sortase B protein-sorting domain-containing protein n=1 Tax=Streptococcus suis TaxID=1307 RepID=UPI000CF5BCE1|nr:QVPTGV class sortase B protein-sorting domain-containing protein [Streptococcus suis]MCK4018909.1 QVPTGV class sortase B protein-sorting domain-containing protein [Streptococcus suis]MDD7566017.1 QVPTGV class sortase B protein-sorting domain-containing protein [Streptococcus suis]MDY5054792.1 QVPTGV class sortase B protein-sorting domain-containing protein [Streptococcus suis]NQN31677.1 QVPTGV class sortase B protein-sorting domain-containing protein [Streptococcus suis]NQO28665.1 QVPTGV cl